MALTPPKDLPPNLLRPNPPLLAHPLLPQQRHLHRLSRLLPRAPLPRRHRRRHKTSPHTPSRQRHRFRRRFWRERWRGVSVCGGCYRAEGGGQGVAADYFGDFGGYLGVVGGFAQGREEERVM